MKTRSGSDPRVEAAARDLLLERGVHDFSMRALAKRLGVTAPALYRTYRGRDDLLIAVVERSYDLLHDKLFLGLQGRDAHERLATVAHGYLTFALDHPRDFAMLSLLPGAFGLDRLPRTLREREVMVLRAWTDRVRDAMDAGILRAGDPEEAAILLWSSARGILELHLRKGLSGERAGAYVRALYWRCGIALLEGIRGPAWSRDVLPPIVQPELDPGV